MKFIKNVLFTLVSSIFVMVMNFVVSIILARTLGPTGQGIYAICILFPMTILTFTNLGISRSSIYHIGKKKYNFNDLLSNIITLNLVIIIISLLVGFFILIVFGNELFAHVPLNLLLLGLLLLPLQATLFQSIYGIILGVQKIKIYNLLYIIQNASLFIFIVLLVLFLGKNIFGGILANIISLVITTSLAIYLTHRFFGFGKKFSFNKEIINSLVIFGFKINLGAAVSYMHLRVDTFILNAILLPESVGYYAIAVGIAELLGTFSGNVSTVLYPKVAAMKDEESKNQFTPIVSRNNLLITFMGSLLILFFSQWLIVLLYSNEYLPSVQPLQILLIGVIFISVERILTNDLIARGKAMINVYVTSAMLIVNIILNLILIPKYGINGAALSTSVSYTLAFFLIMYFYSKISGNKVSDIIIPKYSDLIHYIKFFRILKSKIKSKNI